VSPSLSPYCFCIFAFPLSVLFLFDNSACLLFSLSLVLRYSTPASFFFSIFSYISFCFQLRSLDASTVFASLVLSYLSFWTSCSFDTLSFLFSILLPLSTDHLWRIATSLLLRSPFNVPALFQKTAPVSAFCSQAPQTKGKERDDGQE